MTKINERRSLQVFGKFELWRIDVYFVETGDLISVVETEAVGPVGFGIRVIRIDGVISRAKGLFGTEGKVRDPDATDQVLVFFVEHCDMEICNFVMLPISEF